MRLRTKMSAVILVTWALMFTIVYIGSSVILEDSYIRLENRQATDHVNRAQEALDQMAESVGLIASSNAVWNDAYQFAADKNEAFIKANLQLASLVGFGTDMLLFFNAEGQSVYNAVLNPENTAVIPLPEKFEEYLTPKGKLVYQPNVDSHVEGLAYIPAGILLVASHSIVKGDNTGPVHGTLVAVKYFTAVELEKLKEITKLDIAVFRYEDIQKNPKLEEIYKGLAKQSPYIEKASTQMYGFALLKDLNGKPFGMIEVTMPRGIYAVGKESIRYFSTAFFAAGIIFVLLLLYLFRTLITDRLESLNKQVIQIGAHQSFNKRLKEEGHDELTSVESEINKMLDMLQMYNQEIKEAETFVTNIINAMPSMLIITDDKLTIKRLNSSAEIELDLTNKNAEGKDLLKVFPLLASYEQKFLESIEQNQLNSIDRIDYFDDDKMRYLSVMIYPLVIGPKKYLVTRIDDITERVNISEKLVQNDKLASIGVLTAGVAHEINNPINFVIATIDPLQEDFADILAILKKYLALKTEKDFAEKISEIEKMKNDCKIDYVIEEIEKLLPSIKEGATRTARIVDGLKSFTRLDEDAMKKANIHEGIDSTLTLLRHTFSDRIKVEKDYGNIPEIDCYPGKLNQVFMNILSNAVDAMPEGGEIKIKTWQEGDKVIISIKDTGAGIPAEGVSKIFEPFYTTKDVGKGTGLGLSISFGIIRDHNGSIEVKSKLNAGTEFIITLPISHPV